MEAIIFDVDSTLYSHKENKIPDKTLVALKKLKEINFPRAICTSRFSFEISNLPQDLFNYFDLVILSSGNEIIYNKELIKVSELSKENIELYMKYIIENNIEYRFTTIGHKMVYSPNTNKILVERLSILTSTKPNIGEYANQRLISLAYFNVNEKQKDILENLTENVSIVEFEHSGQVCAKGINKAHSLLTLSEIYGIDVNKIIAVGDGLNDVAMIKEAGIGVAVGNSHPKLLTNADYISETIEDGGIYNICKHFNIF
jgi:hypothetical protein